MSDIYDAHVIAQRQKGLRQYGVTLSDAALTVPEAATHALAEAVDLAEYLRDLAARIGDDGPDLLGYPRHVLTGALASLADEVETVARGVIAPLAEPPPELPPMVPTRDAVERWGHYWYRGKRVIPVALSAREDDAPWDYFTGRLIDPTDDWRGPVPRAPRGVR